MKDLVSVILFISNVHLFMKPIILTEFGKFIDEEYTYENLRIYNHYIENN